MRGLKIAQLPLLRPWRNHVATKGHRYDWSPSSVRRRVVQRTVLLVCVCSLSHGNFSGVMSTHRLLPRLLLESRSPDRYDTTLTFRLDRMWTRNTSYVSYLLSFDIELIGGQSASTAAIFVSDTCVVFHALYDGCR